MHFCVFVSSVFPGRKINSHQKQLGFHAEEGINQNIWACYTSALQKDENWVTADNDGFRTHLHESLFSIVFAVYNRF